MITKELVMEVQSASIALVNTTFGTGREVDDGLKT
jgi:hypothetical protein